MWIRASSGIINVNSLTELISSSSNLYENHMDKIIDATQHMQYKNYYLFCFSRDNRINERF